MAGLLIAVIIEGFGHIEGAFVNPVISVLFTLARQVSVLKG